jgi:hypothetical protein
VIQDAPFTRAWKLNGMKFSKTHCHVEWSQRAHAGKRREARLGRPLSAERRRRPSRVPWGTDTKQTANAVHLATIQRARRSPSTALPSIWTPLCSTKKKTLTVPWQKIRRNYRGVMVSPQWEMLNWNWWGNTSWQMKVSKRFKIDFTLESLCIVCDSTVK